MQTPSDADTTPITMLAQKSELNFTPDQPGIARCIARNTEGNDSAISKVMIGDLEEALHVWIESVNQPIAAGDSLKLHCGALAYNYSAELNWYLDDMPVTQTDGKLKLLVFDLMKIFPIIYRFNNI